MNLTTEFKKLDLKGLAPKKKKHRYDLYQGDCLEKLGEIEALSVDSVVSDPPAGISFMNAEWDKDKGGRDEWIKWMTEVMSEVNRVLKPGGHALIWAIPKTSHWTATAIEDAGFEIRDVICHIFGSGFPKSMDIGKVIVRKKGEKKFEGWGTALKPGAENWILARKPLEGGVIDTVLKHRTGGLNIDDSRVQGRWPNNVMLTHSASCGINGKGWRCASDCPTSIFPGEEQRYFYCAKPSQNEKNVGLTTEGEKVKDGRKAYSDRPYLRGETLRKNTHPTIKSIVLMRYLTRLITPPNGIVLDPFMGSGTTGIAAMKEGFRFIGIEKEAKFFKIARSRIGDATL